MAKKTHRILTESNICVFREEADLEKHAGVTKEHLWPEWMKEIFPRSKEENEGKHYHRYQEIRLSADKIMKINMSGSAHRGPIAARKLRIVCGKCNNGWMGKIEYDVKEILKKLILGENAIISVEKQMAICRWVVLKSILGEYTHLPTQAIPIGDRMFLKNNLSVPPNWKIFIGHFLGVYNGCKQRYSHSGGKVDVTGDVISKENNLQATCFSIGEIFIYAISSHLENIDKWVPPNSLIQIWPNSDESIAWPPLSALGNHHADELRNSLRDFAISTSGENDKYIIMNPSYII